MNQLFDYYCLFIHMLNVCRCLVLLSLLLLCLSRSLLSWDAMQMKLLLEFEWWQLLFLSLLATGGQGSLSVCVLNISENRPWFSGTILGITRVTWQLVTVVHERMGQERVKACQRMGIRNPWTGLSPQWPRFPQMSVDPHMGVRPRTCGSSLGMKGEVRRYLRIPLCDLLGNHPGWKSWGLVTHTWRSLFVEISTDLSLSLCTLPLSKSKYLNTFTISLSTLPPGKKRISLLNY